MQRIARYIALLTLAALFTLALWYRVTSLEAFPDPEGDECWFGTQFAHMARGESFETVTPLDNPLTPFQALIEIPLLLVFKPAFWILRVPSVAANVLAVILIFVLGSRVLDRTTALIAAGLAAVLPFAILQSRTGYDCSQTPLYGIIAIYFAFQTNVVGLIALLAVNYYIHPTNLFVAPLLVSVFVVRSLQKSENGLAKMLWPLFWKTGLLGGMALGLGLYTLWKPRIQFLTKCYSVGGRHDFFHYWTLYGRLLLGIGRDPDRLALESGDPDLANQLASTAGGGVYRLDVWLFWTIVLSSLAYGGWRLARNRQWDRLALIVGVFLSGMALFIVAGSDILRPGMTRWGSFLFVPSVLGFACLVRGMLVEPRIDRGIVPTRWIQNAALLALGWALLLSFSFERVTILRVFEGRYAGTSSATMGTKTLPLWASLKNRRVTDADQGESIWTFRNEAKDAKQRVLRLIRRDIRAGAQTETSDHRTQPHSGTIIAEDYWVYTPLHYLTIGRHDLDILGYHNLVQGPVNRNQRVRELMESGAYALVYPNREFESVLRVCFAAKQLQKWDILRDGQPYLSVYRLRKDITPSEAIHADLARSLPATPAWYAQYVPGSNEARGPAQPAIPVPGDYDGDGKAQLAVFRPATAQWLIQQADGSCCEMSFGAPHLDVPVPGDYDGDGKTDLAVFRPSTAQWLILRSDGTTQETTHGVPGSDIPVPGDYDGDGKTDLAVFQVQNASWLIRNIGGAVQSINYGIPHFVDIPVPGDYDGDGKTEPAVFRPSTAQWLSIRREQPIAFGANNMIHIPVPAKYDRLGYTVLAVFQPSTGQWIIGCREKPFTIVVNHYRSIPVPCDYDGDGIIDLAVFLPESEQWQLMKSSAGFTPVVTAVIGGDESRRNRMPGNPSNPRAAARPAEDTITR
jgi:hypothetical protein